MTAALDLDRLDDPAALAALDPSDMLRAVATSAAQVRASRTTAGETDLTRVDPGARPRAVVVVGMGGSGISGDVLAAVAGPGCPVPIVVHRGYGLPGWVGTSDLVMAVSCSGTTQETRTAVADVARRGARLVGVGSGGSPMADECEAAGGVFVPVTAQLCPRSSLWALAVPCLVVAARFRLLSLGVDDADLEAAATRLESIAATCRPDRETFLNPAKLLAGELADTLPMVWGSGRVGPVAALRTMCQLAENAKLPSVVGALPEAHHNQVVALDGPLAGTADGTVADDDLFRDRVEAAPSRLGIRLLLVRDDAGDRAAADRAADSRAAADPAARRAAVSVQLARTRGVGVSQLLADGGSPLERLASLVGVIDYASVYLGLAHGIDPTPIGPIDELKRALA